MFDFRIVGNTDISRRFHETSGLPVIRQEQRSKNGFDSFRLFTTVME